jgi:hypothetical protein
MKEAAAEVLDQPEQRADQSGKVCSLNTSATTTKTARILGCGREPRTTEYASPPPGAFFLRIDWAGCIIVAIGLPDPDQLFTDPYIGMPDVPSSSPKENLRVSKNNTYPRPASLFDPRHNRNRSIFYADEILALHSSKLFTVHAGAGLRPALQLVAILLQCNAHQLTARSHSRLGEKLLQARFNSAL